MAHTKRDIKTYVNEPLLGVAEELDFLVNQMDNGQHGDDYVHRLSRAALACHTACERLHLLADDSRSTASSTSLAESRSRRGSVSGSQVEIGMGSENLGGSVSESGGVCASEDVGVGEFEVVEVGEGDGLGHIQRTEIRTIRLRNDVDFGDVLSAGAVAPRDGDGVHGRDGDLDSYRRSNAARMHIMPNVPPRTNPSVPSGRSSSPSSVSFSTSSALPSTVYTTRGDLHVVPTARPPAHKLAPACAVSAAYEPSRQPSQPQAQAQANQLQVQEHGRALEKRLTDDNASAAQRATTNAATNEPKNGIANEKIEAHTPIASPPQPPVHARTSTNQPSSEALAPLSTCPAHISFKLKLCSMSGMPTAATSTSLLTGQQTAILSDRSAAHTIPVPHASAPAPGPAPMSAPNWMPHPLTARAANDSSLVLSSLALSSSSSSAAVSSPSSSSSLAFSLTSSTFASSSSSSLSWPDDESSLTASGCACSVSHVTMTALTQSESLQQAGDLDAAVAVAEAARQDLEQRWWGLGYALCQRQLAVLYQARGRLDCAEECIRWYIAHLTNRFDNPLRIKEEQASSHSAAMTLEQSRKLSAVRDELALAHTLLSSIVACSRSDTDGWSEEMRDLDHQAMRVMYEARTSPSSELKGSSASTPADSK